VTAGPAIAPKEGPPVRDAATVILLRHAAEGRPQVLMGQRGARAVFMPSKFVFPGGALDPEDAGLAEVLVIDPLTERRLAARADPALARPLALAAIRELFEETGLALGRPDPAAARLAARAPATLRPMLEAGLLPDARGLDFVFRAVTPPGRPRRFDARFFLADAARLHGDVEDFGRACGELSALAWIDLVEARRLELPFITEVVLSEIEAILSAGGAPRPVPFFHHDATGTHVSLV
jgi:8-oxo-dGTP pyrophosphatase MutT (NUDIX family)